MKKKMESVKWRRLAKILKGMEGRICQLADKVGRRKKKGDWWT